MNEMLPYFAACGHSNYTKFVWLYLLQMSLLESEYPDIFEDFLKGFHVVRRSESRLWAGISPDQVIEQTLMRSVKSTGGLTRGTGFDSAQRNVYLFSKPARAEISLKMQSFACVESISSDQHKNEGASRVERDKLLIWGIN